MTSFAAKALFCVAFLGSIQVQMAQALFSSTPAEKETYLVCYYADKSTGQISWDWAKDKDKKYVKVKGIWTGEGGDALLSIDGLAKDYEPTYAKICKENNKETKRDYAEYGISDDSISFKHEIWFEETEPNPYQLPFSRVVAFGDSLSDNGNLFNYTHQELVSGSYYLGRWSDGPVWIEYLAKDLKLDLYDWAIGGVTSDTDFPLPYSMNDEVSNYLKTMEHVKKPDYEHTLYTILIGANNYIFHVDNKPEDIVNLIIRDMHELIAKGALNFIVPNLPDISYTPFLEWQGASPQDVVHAKIILHNKLLAKALEEIKNENPSITLMKPNTFDFLENVHSNPSEYGLTNVTEKCDKGLPLGKYNASTFCADPKNYLFWDFVHPSTKVHCEMAQDIMEQMPQTFGGLTYSKHYKDCNVTYVKNN